MTDVQSGHSVGVWQALKQHARVIGALVLREARVRHGRTQFGYLWAVVEPVFYVIMLSALFSSARGRVAPFGESMSLFFACGILPYHLFRNTVQQLGAAFEANKPLFSYPVIAQIDAVYARLILEVATWCLVVVLVFTFIVLVLDAPLPHDLPQSIMAALLVVLLGFGIGLFNAVVRRKYLAWGVMFNVATSPLLFVSGVFFTMESIPSQYREYLAWNPLIHGVEGIRMGYYPNYRSSDLDLNYLLWWGVISLFLGLFLERFTRSVELQ